MAALVSAGGTTNVDEFDPRDLTIHLCPPPSDEYQYLVNVMSTYNMCERLIYRCTVDDI